MTQEQFLQKAQVFLLNMKIIDTESRVSYSRLKQTYIDDDNHRLIVVIEDNDFIPNSITNTIDHQITKWTMEVNQGMVVQVVDAEGNPKFNTVVQNKWNETTQQAEFVSVQVPVVISEWEMWKILVFNSKAVSLSEAFMGAIMRKKGLINTPMVFPEQV